MTTAAKQPNVTRQLDALCDQVGVEALCLSFAQALAEAHDLNRTCAGIRFNRWHAAPLAEVQPQQEQAA